MSYSFLYNKQLSCFLSTPQVEQSPDLLLKSSRLISTFTCKFDAKTSRKSIVEQAMQDRPFYSGLSCCHTFLTLTALLLTLLLRKSLKRLPQEDRLRQKRYSSRQERCLFLIL